MLEISAQSGTITYVSQIHRRTRRSSLLTSALAVVLAMWVDEGAECGLDGAGDAPPSLHILLAEDDTPSLCILNRLLSACGYRGARSDLAPTCPLVC